jgi:hypothetical protein
MQMRKFSAVFLLLPSLFFPHFAAAQAKVEKIGPPSDGSVPAAVRTALDAGGAKLVRPDGSVLCEIWLAKTLPAAKAAAAKGTAYPELSESMFVGVISFPNGGKDFRGQAIKPGFFTMRYELLPEDGNHLGVAPTRDFVLLVPASADSDPKAPYDLAQLVKLSAQAAGTNHPAAFLLLAPDIPTLSAPNPRADKGGATEPRTYQNADGYQVFAGTLKTEGGKTAPVALVVKGQAEQ